MRLERKKFRNLIRFNTTINILFLLSIIIHILIKYSLHESSYLLFVVQVSF